MCVNIEVILPTVEKFLILYSLRCGSLIILCWTTIRTGFCILFYSTTILEVLIGEESPLGSWLVTKKPAIDFVYIIYYTILTLLLCETVIFVFMIHLTLGLCCFKTQLLQHYLICRFVTWLIELVGLFVLCLAHKLLIGWYLAILFFVILEFYSFIVVYSYYVSLVEENKHVFSLLSLGVLSFSLYRVITYVKIHESEPDPEHTPEEYEQVSSSLYVTHAYIIIVYLYYIIINLMLILGIHMNKSTYIKYYFNCGLFLLMLALATVVVSTVFLHFIATIYLLKWCIIIFYCLIVVRSTYLEIEEKSRPSDFQMQNLYIPHRAPLLL